MKKIIFLLLFNVVFGSFATGCYINDLWVEDCAEGDEESLML